MLLMTGAAAVLALCFAAYVAFTSTNGLPFTPAYRITFQVANAAQATKGDDVTIAGLRIGQVSGVSLGPLGGGRSVAEIHLAINPSQGPLPADTRFAIRLSGTLGRKTVAVYPGSSTQTLPSGATVSAGHVVGTEVDLDQFFDAFSAKARAGQQDALDAFGLGFAGRGNDLNDALGQLPGMLANLAPVMRSLSVPSTHLSRFFGSLSDFAGALAPVAHQQAHLFVELDRTFQAMASVATPYIQRAIALTPDTLSTATADLRDSHDFMVATASLLHNLQPASAELPATAPVFADALATGVKNLPEVPGLDARLAQGTDALARFGELQPTVPGLARLAATAASAQPPLAFLAPAETTCSYVSLLLRNLGSVFSDSVASGTLARVGGVVIATARNSEEGPSSAIYSGRLAPGLGPLHTNPYPNTAAPDQVHECEAGWEPYLPGVRIGSLPVRLPAHTESPTRLP